VGFELYNLYEQAIVHRPTPWVIR